MPRKDSSFSSMCHGLHCMQLVLQFSRQTVDPCSALVRDVIAIFSYGGPLGNKRGCCAFLWGQQSYDVISLLVVDHQLMLANARSSGLCTRE